MAFTVGSMGLATLLPLLKLVITYYAALIVFVLLGFVAGVVNVVRSAGVASGKR